MRVIVGGTAFLLAFVTAVAVGMATNPYAGLVAGLAAGGLVPAGIAMVRP